MVPYFQNGCIRHYIIPLIVRLVQHFLVFCVYWQQSLSTCFLLCLHYLSEHKGYEAACWLSSHAGYPWLLFWLYWLYWSYGWFGLVIFLVISSEHKLVRILKWVWVGLDRLILFRMYVAFHLRFIKELSKIKLVMWTIISVKKSVWISL